MAADSSKLTFSRESSNDEDASKTETESPSRPASQYRGGISLDVLAEVASATLKCEPRPGPTSPTPPLKERKPATKTLQSQDVLSLSQIRNLSDKQLVPLFSELTSNELNRKYSYRCWLVPDECTKTFSSFGNEMRAKNQLTLHLRMHIAEITKKEEEGLIHFMAEPIGKRIKRMHGDSTKKKKKAPLPVPPAKKQYRPRKQFKQTEVININVSKDEPDQEYYLQVDNTDELKKDEEILTSTTVEEGSDHGEEYAPRQIDTVTDLLRAARTAELVKKTITENLKQSQLRSLMCGVPPEESAAYSDAGKESSSVKYNENEQLITDLLRRNQPYQDHNYTTVFGKKEGIGQMYNQLSSIGDWEMGNDSSSRTYPLKCNQGENQQVVASMPQAMEIKLDSPPEGSSIQIPIIRLSRMLGFGESTDFVEIKSKDQVISLYNIDSQDNNSTEAKDSASKPYPPMPKSDIAKKGKIPLPQEVYGSSEEEDSHIMCRGKRKKIIIEGSVEWEKKMATKYIRELRNKKHENQMLYQCKLCINDKSYTAAATLISHYRSHAGIKPYVCLICNTTFTRQHSLNYHMLIHNNQSRFTCKECGRKFRHPSHFREHLRRHTGETPYQCPDCSMFFKTRNTYKRHLKTRHKKLLTAAGISPMESQEPPRPPSEENSMVGDFAEGYTNGVEEVDVVTPGTGVTIITPDELTTAMLKAQHLVDS